METLASCLPFCQVSRERPPRPAAKRRGVKTIVAPNYTWALLLLPVGFHFSEFKALSVIRKILQEIYASYVFGICTAAKYEVVQEIK